MILGGLDYSCTTNQNVQCVTVEVEKNAENFGQERIMMLGGLDYSCTTNQNVQGVTVVLEKKEILVKREV